MGRKLIETIALVAFILCLVSPAWAVPGIINYQGKLTNTSDCVLTGTYQIRFLLYDTETDGTALWDEVQSTNVDNGLFNVRLGAVASFPIGLFESDSLYLETVVLNPDSGLWETLSPRQRITSAAYAIKADHAATAGDADTVDGKHASELIVPETDPTVPENLKDGVSWNEVANIPADIADGDQVGITTEQDPKVGSTTANSIPKWDGATGKLVDSSSVFEDIIGNVGIGKTNPSFKLDVNGTINATEIYKNGVPFSGLSQWSNIIGGVSYTGGNVGIGTTEPAGKLHINGGGIVVTNSSNSLWGDGSDGAVVNLADADTDATSVSQASPATLAHNRIVRATGNINLTQTVTVNQQNGQARGNFPSTHGGSGVELGAILSTLGSKGVPQPMRPGGDSTGICGGIVQFMSGDTVNIGSSIQATGASTAGEGGGGGGLVVIIAKNAITGSGNINVSGADGHATAAARGGAGAYSGEPGGHAGLGGSGGGGGGCPGGSIPGGAGGAGIVAGKNGGSGSWEAGGGGACIDNAGSNADGTWNGADGGDGNNILANQHPKDTILQPGGVRPIAAAEPGGDNHIWGPIGGAAGDNGGGGGGGARGADVDAGDGGNGGCCGSGGGGGGQTAPPASAGDGGDGAAGSTYLYVLSSRSIYAGLPGGQGGGGGGGYGCYSGSTNPGLIGTGGAGAPGVTAFVSGQGAGSGGAGASGNSGVYQTGGSGGTGGNGGGAAGMVLMIAPSISYSGTVTGRLVKVESSNALDFIRGYYTD